MVLSIKKRLGRLQEHAKQQKKSNATSVLDLWLEFLSRNDDSLNIPDYISPPFRNVSAEDCERARKELEEYDRQTE